MRKNRYHEYQVQVEHVEQTLVVVGTIRNKKGLPCRKIFRWYRVPKRLTGLTYDILGSTPKQVLLPAEKKAITMACNQHLKKEARHG